MKKSNVVDVINKVYISYTSAFSQELAVCMARRLNYLALEFQGYLQM